MPYSRRCVLALSGTIATGGIALYSLSDRSKAQVQIDGLNVSDAQKEVSNPVNSVRVDVDTQYSYDAEVVPTKVVLRLEGTTQSESTQLDAIEPDSLSQSQEGSPTLNGNLLDLPGLTAPDLSPQEVGESVTETVTLRLKLTIRHDGRVIKTATETDDALIEITKTKPGATISLGGTGEITIQTSG